MRFDTIEKLRYGVRCVMRQALSFAWLKLRSAVACRGQRGYRTGDLSMNNEILSCAENRDASENARKNKRARDARPRRENGSHTFLSADTACKHLHDTRGSVCSRRLYQLFRYFRRGGRNGRVRMPVAPFSIARSLAGARCELSLCIAKIISAAVATDEDDDEKDDDDDNEVRRAERGRQRLRQRETTELPRTFI